MKRREFNSIDEAIEALDEIANIDYSKNVSEITEREFYSKLLNNFMGIKKINLTKEDREKYKVALSKKGLLKYSNWKSMQPESKEAVTWKGAVEKGLLDAPVNLFSKLLEAEDESKFDYIRDVVDEEKSNIGKDWLGKNNEVLKDIEKNNSYDVNNILSETQSDLSSFVNDILKEKEEEKNKSEIKSKDLETKKMEKFAEKFGSYKTPDEAIDALKSIDKIEYKRGNEIDKLKEKKFYNDIMKNLVASSKLNFSDNESYRYKKALESIGCKERAKLNKLNDIDKDVDLPVDIVSSILQSTKGDHYHNLKAQKERIRHDGNVKNWIENTDKYLELSSYTENLEKELDNILDEEDRGRNNKNLPVPAKKKGFFKKIGTRVALFVTSAAAVFGVTSTAAKAADNDDINVRPGLAKNIGNNVVKDIKNSAIKNAEKPISVNIDLPDTDSFTLELQSNVKDEYTGGVKSVIKNVSDSAYTKTPDANVEKLTKSNEMEMEENEQNNIDEEKANIADIEVASKDLKVESKKENTGEKVVINDDGSAKITTENGSEINVEDVKTGGEYMEREDLGLIEFESAYTEPLEGEFVEINDEENLTR